MAEWEKQLGAEIAKSLTLSYGRHRGFGIGVNVKVDANDYLSKVHETDKQPNLTESFDVFDSQRRCRNVLIRIWLRPTQCNVEVRE